jgi:hypothetical protein
VAARVLATIDPALEAPTSVREAGARPWAAPLSALPELAKEEAGEGGKVAVVVPDSLLSGLGTDIAAYVPGTVVVTPGAGRARGAEALDAPVAVMGVTDAKGLEFDSVIVAEPDLIAAQSPRGPSDLYVALTRATQRLGVVHERPLSQALRDLPSRSPAPANGL